MYFTGPFTRKTMRDIKVILLSLLSVGLIGTWAYHLYDKTRYTQVRNETTARDSLALADALRDSLQSLYQTALQQMDEKLELTDSSLSFTQVRADSLQRTLDGRMLEIGRLRTEVQQILARGRSTSPEEMALARQKIAELQGQVDQLESQKNSMEAEKADLTRTHLSVRRAEVVGVSLLPLAWMAFKRMALATKILAR